MGAKKFELAQTWFGTLECDPTLARGRTYPPQAMTLPVTLPIAGKKYPISPYSTQLYASGICLINQVFTAV